MQQWIISNNSFLVVSSTLLSQRNFVVCCAPAAFNNEMLQKHGLLESNSDAVGNIIPCWDYRVLQKIIATGYDSLDWGQWTAAALPIFSYWRVCTVHQSNYCTKCNTTIQHFSFCQWPLVQNLPMQTPREIINPVGHSNKFSLTPVGLAIPLIGSSCQTRTFRE